MTTTECVEITASLSTVGRRRREAFVALTGALIPDGSRLWTRCRNRRCISPEHAYYPTHTVDTSGCWPWVGALNEKGYPLIARSRTSHPGPGSAFAHRHYYEMNVGPIPPDLTLDHLCGNKSCVNPDHLEPVTNAENQRRAAVVRTHFRCGHPIDDENLLVDSTGARRCRTCRSEQRHRRYLERGV